MSEAPTSPSSASGAVSDLDPSTPGSRRGGARRGVDPVTSSPGRDLPEFENEDELLGGTGATGDDEEDGEGENLFGDAMEADYRPMPHLDNFDPNMLDEEEYDAMSEGNCTDS